MWNCIIKLLTSLKLLHKISVFTVILVQRDIMNNVNNCSPSEIVLKGTFKYCSFIIVCAKVLILSERWEVKFWNIDTRATPFFIILHFSIRICKQILIAVYCCTGKAIRKSDGSTTWQCAAAHVLIIIDGGKVSGKINIHILPALSLFSTCNFPRSYAIPHDFQVVSMSALILEHAPLCERIIISSWNYDVVAPVCVHHFFLARAEILFAVSSIPAA